MTWFGFRFLVGLCLTLAVAHEAGGQSMGSRPGPVEVPDQAPPAAPAPAAPVCRAELEGQLSCQANRVCECGFRQAVPARGLPDRWVWDCGITRPRCRSVPAEIQEFRGQPIPHGAYGPSGYLPPNVFITVDEQGRERLVVNGQMRPLPARPPR
ncbi:hypothetical protein CCR80_04300 [Rhodothalassium salexigens]|uniref:hypothetical protein n=1 Tax=Rhodothalassium salexigens TaxID=1086 RepID=UPI00191450AF|nr:hypothetical protein [Rhodothalassium salexigens]MBK5920260.1 hypothetical protein [Rhodothalassium salexigens]